MWLYPKLRDTCTGSIEIIILFKQVNRQKGLVGSQRIPFQSPNPIHN